jgi:hypothetical protein
VGSRCVTDMLYRREVKIPQLLGEGEHGKGGQQMCHWPAVQARGQDP